MTREEFRDLMVKLVRSAGKELIDRAEDFVGDGDLMCDFHISIDIVNAFEGEEARELYRKLTDRRGE